MLTTDNIKLRLAVSKGCNFDIAMIYLINNISYKIVIKNKINQVYIFTVPNVIHGIFVTTFHALARFIYVFMQKYLFL